MVKLKFPATVKLFQKAAIQAPKVNNNQMPTDVVIYNPTAKKHMSIFFHEVVEHKVCIKNGKSEFIFLLKLHRDS